MSEIIKTLTKKGDASVEVYPNIKRDNIPSGAINTSKLDDASVTTAKIVDGAVSGSKLASGSVSTINIANASVTSDKLGTEAVTTSKIDDGAVTTAKLNTEVHRYQLQAVFTIGTIPSEIDSGEIYFDLIVDDTGYNTAINNFSNFYDLVIAQNLSGWNIGKGWLISQDDNKYKSIYLALLSGNNLNIESINKDNYESFTISASDFSYLTLSDIKYKRLI